MHHIHKTKAFVLSSYPFGEAGKILNLLTEDFGLIRTQAHGIRKVTSKLRQSTQDFSMAKIAMVYGKTGWRLTNASILEDYYHKFDKKVIKIIARIFSLLERMIPDEENNPEIFEITNDLFFYLETKKDELKEHTSQAGQLDSIEIATVLKILNELGYIGEDESIQNFINLDYEEVIKNIRGKNEKMIKIINEAIKESHL